jgi:hypothetical protein
LLPYLRFVKEIRLTCISKEAKLAELRAKTDIELVRYVNNELSHGARFASQSNPQSHSRAEEAYSEIARLLPVVHGLDESERRRLEAKLKRLRAMLDRVPALTRAAY